MIKRGFVLILILLMAGSCSNKKYDYYHLSTKCADIENKECIFKDIKAHKNYHDGNDKMFFICNDEICIFATLKN